MVQFVYTIPPSALRVDARNGSQNAPAVWGRGATLTFAAMDTVNDNIGTVSAPLKVK